MRWPGHPALPGARAVRVAAIKEVKEAVVSESVKLGVFWQLDDLTGLTR